MLSVLALVGAGSASAHALRVAADPAPDSSVGTGPARASATFNEQLQTDFAAMTVVGPDGNLWSTGAAEITGAVASVALRPLGPTGTYTVNYRVTSADGHVVNGAWSFDLTVAGTGTPGPKVAQSADRSDGLPVWPFVALAAAIVAVGAWVAVRRRG
ncbi:copper resistance CopC family protein [Mycolicibacterium sp.]|uniref:copper resistance CopC family protein n=1 Tax=Mycolicibacterium sp. TaxID=2320850 RepID=UPI001A33C269|nr:copper resistance CopC family protein [Mycolicibacterium sp.]MBJ7341419.1 copper resistance protein CopC [Mycolicibacterium sp.]